MENFQEEIALIKKILKAKSLATIIVVSLVALFIWKNSDFITKVSFTISNDQKNISGLSKEKDSSSGDHKNISGINKENDISSGRNKYYKLDFGQIYLPPKSNTLPSIIVFEIKNIGNAVLNNIHIMLDMGGIKAIKYEIVGVEIGSSNSGDVNNSIANFDIKNLHPKNSLYLHVMVESPLFKRIVINADNLPEPQELNYENYILDKRDVDDIGLWKWPLSLIILLISIGIFFLIIYLIKGCTIDLLGLSEKQDKNNDPNSKKINE